MPLDAWLSVGKHAATLAAGLQQPENGVHLITGIGQRPTAGAGGTTATVPWNPILTEGIPSRTTIGTTATTQPLPPGSGKVITKQMSSGSSFVQGVAVNNKSGKTVNIADSLAHRPALSFDKTSDKPQVLITHTHTTECYLNRNDGTYDPKASTRTNDSTKNMVAVGRVIADQLQAAGIGVIHDTVIHDQPYNGAYAHSKAEVQKLLKQYPTIRVVLDVHRDAIYPSDNSRIRPVAEINGKTAAQVMIIVGMLNSSSAPNTHTKENLAFGVRLQQRLHRDYPGLVRPLSLADARYNQQLTNGSLLLEMGSDVNSLEEALYAGELVGKGLTQVLLSLD